MRNGWLRCLAVAVALAAMLLTPALAEESALITVEAETGELLGGARVSLDGTKVENLTAAGDGVTVTIAAPETGFYDIVVRAASIGGGKTNYIDVDGARMGEIVTDSAAAQDCVLERVYLEAGLHEVSVVGFWCWITIDKISLRASEALPEDLFDVEPVLINPNATENARRLMHYLTDVYGKAVLSGQYCDKGAYGPENASIASVTGGEYPAVLGLDMIEYSPSRAAHHRPGELVTTEYAIRYWEQGGIVTYCWHWNVAEKYHKDIWWQGFYTEYVSIDLAAIMSGEDPEGYDLLMKDIDAIAVELGKLQDAGVPVLWRPLHEASGGWFWWGASGPEPYIALYRTLYDRLVNVHGLNNLIWIWNGQDAAWYPGDEYVDIIGEDIYAGERVYTSQLQRFLNAARCTEARKMIVLSENGTIPDPELLFRDGVPWGFFCTWGGDFVTAGGRYSGRYTEESMLQKVYSSDLVITRSELPDLKSYPLPGEE